MPTVTCAKNDRARRRVRFRGVSSSTQARGTAIRPGTRRCDALFAARRRRHSLLSSPTQGSSFSTPPTVRPACAHGRHAPPRTWACCEPECTSGDHAWSTLERAESRRTEQWAAQLLAILSVLDESSARAMLCPCRGGGPPRATSTSARSFARHTPSRARGGVGDGYSEAYPKSR